MVPYLRSADNNGVVGSSRSIISTGVPDLSGGEGTDRKGLCFGFWILDSGFAVPETGFVAGFFILVMTPVDLGINGGLEADSGIGDFDGVLDTDAGFNEFSEALEDSAPVVAWVEEETVEGEFVVTVNNQGKRVNKGQWNVQEVRWLWKGTEAKGETKFQGNRRESFRATEFRGLKGSGGQSDRARWKTVTTYSLIVLVAVLPSAGYWQQMASMATSKRSGWSESDELSLYNGLEVSTVAAIPKKSVVLGWVSRI